MKFRLVIYFCLYLFAQNHFLEGFAISTSISYKIVWKISSVMLPMGKMEMVIFYTTFSPMGAMYLHARTFWTLAHTTSIPVGVMYLHARMFCTLSDTILYPLRAPIFILITEDWPRANRAMVTNNSTLIIGVVLIEVVLIEGFLY